MYIHRLPKFWTWISKPALFFQNRPKKNGKKSKKLQNPHKISFFFSIGIKNYKSQPKNFFFLFCNRAPKLVRGIYIKKNTRRSSVTLSIVLYLGKPKILTKRRRERSRDALSIRLYLPTNHNQSQHYRNFKRNFGWDL